MIPWFFKAVFLSFNAILSDKCFCVGLNYVHYIVFENLVEDIRIYGAILSYFLPFFSVGRFFLEVFIVFFLFYSIWGSLVEFSCLSG